MKIGFELFNIPHNLKEWQFLLVKLETGDYSVYIVKIEAKKGNCS